MLWIGIFTFNCHGMGVFISSPVEKCCFLMYICHFKMTTIMQCLWNTYRQISTSIEDSDMSNFIILIDFNSAVTVLT